MARSNSNSPGRDGDATNLYITNLNYSAKEEDLQKLFEDYGKIASFKIVKDPTTNKSRGFGFVAFERPEDADKARASLNNSEVQGRQLRVEKARRTGAYESTPGKYMGNDRYRRSPRREHREHRTRSRERDRSRDYRDRDRDRDYRDRDRDNRDHRDRDYRNRDYERDRRRRSPQSPRRKSRSPPSRSTFT